MNLVLFCLAHGFPGQLLCVSVLEAVDDARAKASYECGKLSMISLGSGVVGHCSLLWFLAKTRRSKESWLIPPIARTDDFGIQPNLLRGGRWKPSRSFWNASWKPLIRRWIKQFNRFSICLPPREVLSDEFSYRPMLEIYLNFFAYSGYATPRDFSLSSEQPSCPQLHESSIMPPASSQYWLQNLAPPSGIQLQAGCAHLVFLCCSAIVNSLSAIGMLHLAFHYRGGVVQAR